MSQPERLQATAVPAWTRVRSIAVGKWKAVQLSIERERSNASYRARLDLMGNADRL